MNFDKKAFKDLYPDFLVKAIGQNIVLPIVQFLISTYNFQKDLSISLLQYLGASAFNSIVCVSLLHLDLYKVLNKDIFEVHFFKNSPDLAQ